MWERKTKDKGATVGDQKGEKKDAPGQLRRRRNVDETQSEFSALGFRGRPSCLPCWSGWGKRASTSTDQAASVSKSVRANDALSPDTKPSRPITTMSTGEGARFIETRRSHIKHLKLAFSTIQRVDVRTSRSSRSAELRVRSSITMWMGGEMRLTVSMSRLS